jgi:hypothetical protein
VDFGAEQAFFFVTVDIKAHFLFDERTLEDHFFGFGSHWLTLPVWTDMKGADTSILKRGLGHCKGIV